MKILCLVTYTDCENKWRSLEAAGHEVHVRQYDDRPHERHGELVDEARALAPDATVLIGAVEHYHGRPVPRPDALRAIDAVAPMILMCNDAADPPWWPVLEEYERERCFSLYVSIDGARDNPIERFANGVTLLTPIDCRPFNPEPWGKRLIILGMVGGEGHSERQAVTNALRTRGLLDFRQGPVGRSYDDMAAVMCGTKITYNFGMTGSTARMHVKGRVVEAGFAGSALLERAGSPARDWFDLGTDYLEYETVDDIARLVEATPDDVWRAMAKRLRTKMVTRHHPEIFWDTVFGKLRR